MEAAERAFTTWDGAFTPAELDAIVEPLLVKHGLRLRFEEVIYHDDFKKLPDGTSPSDRTT